MTSATMSWSRMAMRARPKPVRKRFTPPHTTNPVITSSSQYHSKSLRITWWPIAGVFAPMLKWPWTSQGQSRNRLLRMAWAANVEMAR